MLVPYEQMLPTEETLDYSVGIMNEHFTHYVAITRSECGEIVDPGFELASGFEKILAIAKAFSYGYEAPDQVAAVYRSMLLALQVGYFMLPATFHVPIVEYINAVNDKDASMKVVFDEANHYMMRCKNLGKLYFTYQQDIDPTGEYPISTTTFALMCMVGEREMARKLLEPQLG